MLRYCDTRDYALVRKKKEKYTPWTILLRFERHVTALLLISRGKSPTVTFTTKDYIPVLFGFSSCLGENVGIPSYLQFFASCRLRICLMNLGTLSTFIHNCNSLVVY